jgi:hypothetical protein
VVALNLMAIIKNMNITVDIDNLYNVLNLFKRYNIKVIFDNNLNGYAMGIGDILFNLLAIKENLIMTPYYFTPFDI